MAKPKPSKKYSSQNIQTQSKGELSRLSRWTTEWITDWWGIEIISWTIAVLSLLSIVVTLEICKRKPVPKLPIHITINSLISILANVGQMAMMKPVVECISQLKWLWFVRKDHLSRFQDFDNASRGPTGSLIFLGKCRGLHLAALGAAITVVSIAFGPFAQQVVTYPQILHPTGISTTPQVLQYTGLDDIYGGLSTEIASSIIQGFQEVNQSLSTVTPRCSTGNCTWNSYPSLGVCPGVVDISSSLIRNPCNQSGFGESPQDSTRVQISHYPCFNWTYPTEQLTVNGFKENVSLTSGIDGPPIHSNDEIDMELLLVFTDSMPNIINNTFMTAYVLYQPYEFYTNTDSSLPDPVAFVLTLDFCLQIYNTSVKDGVVKTIMTSSQPLSTAAFPSGSFDVISNVSPSDSQGTVSLDGNNFGFSQIWRLGNVAAGFFLDSCFQYLTLSINGYLFANGSFDCLLYSGSPFSNPLFTGLNATLADRYSVAENIMNNVAISITNALRMGIANESRVIDFQGTAYTPAPYVNTEYEWLILPIGLVSLTFVFLLATILKSQRLGSRIWKSSNFATLQGLSSELHDELGSLSSISEMEKRVKNIKVVFGGRSGGDVEYRLVEAKRNKYWTG